MGRNCYGPKCPVTYLNQGNYTTISSIWQCNNKVNNLKCFKMPCDNTLIAGGKRKRGNKGCGCLGPESVWGRGVVVGVLVYPGRLV